jgi:hypothetical protein
MKFWFVCYIVKLCPQSQSFQNATHVRGTDLLLWSAGCSKTLANVARGQKISREMNSFEFDTAKACSAVFKAKGSTLHGW